MKTFFCFLVGLVIFFFWVGVYWPVRAITLSLTNVPETIIFDQEFLVQVYFEINAKNTTYYLRPCFYPQGSTSYFGCIKVEGNFICDSQGDKTAYLPITTDDQGIWQGEILVLVGREETGEFNFKVRRYTAGGSVFDSEPVVVNLVDPVLETTPTPSSILSPSPLPVPTVSGSTITPIASPTLVPTPTLTPLPTSMPTPTPQNPTPTNSPQDYNNIFINEVMANPSEGNEWVELYNANSFTVDLENWFLDDLADGGSAWQKFSLTIAPYGYGVVNLSRNIFNNTGDEVRLVNPYGEEKDLFSYSKTVSGQSWGKDEDGNWCLQEPTPQKINLACFSPNPTITPTPIVENQTTDQEDQEKTKVLGNYQHYQINQTPFPSLKTYLIAEDRPKEKLRKEQSSLPRKNWLPDWLLLSGGLLNFGVGLLRVFKRMTP